MYFYFIKIVLLVKMCCGKFSGGVENTIQHLIIRTLFTNHMLVFNLCCIIIVFNS